MHDRTVCGFSPADDNEADAIAILLWAMDAVKDAGLAFKILDDHVETASGHVSIGTMHLAKGWSSAPLR